MIEDFGEKFGGAKKDLAQEPSENFNTVDETAATKTALWPKPNFKQDVRDGNVSPKHAILFMLIYEWIPRSHSGHHFKKRIPVFAWNEAYIRIVNFYRERYENGHYEDRDEIREAFEEFIMDTYPNYGLKSDQLWAATKIIGRNIYQPYSFNMNRTIRYNSLLALGWAEHDVVYDNDGYGVLELRNRKTKKIHWSIMHSNTPQSAEYVEDRTQYPTKEAALVGLKAYFAPILEQRLEEERNKSNEESKRKKPFKRPKLDRDAIRVGDNHRNNEPISMDKFTATFKFRGVEFGNWVTQTERQIFLNETYDAFMDLVQLLGLPPTFSSLGKRLGIAFGSRGNNRASAHFELKKWLIHLTKTKGTGALCHELGHSIDAFLSKRNNLYERFASDYFFHKCGINSSPDKFNNFIDAPIEFHLLIKTMKYKSSGCYTNFYENARLMDSSRSSRYWTNPTEMFARAFETWCTDQLTKKGHVNEFLVYGTEESAEAWNTIVTAYPTGRERVAIVNAMDDWVKAVVAIWLRQGNSGSD